jgi:hypothetical protein
LMAGPVEDLLAARQICLASGQIVRIPAGTAIPLAIRASHPLARLHGCDQGGLSLICDLFVRGGDGFVSLDGAQWMSFETALGLIFPGQQVSSEGGAIVLGLPH